MDVLKDNTTKMTNKVEAMPQTPNLAEKGRFVDGFVCTYIISVLGSWAAEYVTYPLDLTKTRLQIQGELANKADFKLVTAPHRGMVKTALGIAKEEGVSKLWSGISAQLLRHSIYSGTRVVAYQILRERIMKNSKESYLPVWKSAICGITAGTFAQIIANPADVIKVQIQMEGKRRLVGLPARVHGLRHAFVNIVRESGVKGLYKGVVPNAYRAAFINLGDLTTYDSSKRFFIRQFHLRDGPLVHIMSSFSAGFVAACIGTPADTIKTRVMNQPVDEHGRGLYYKTTWDCCKKTVQNEGTYGLFKGFFPNWLRMAPWSLTFWLFYEQSNKLLNRTKNFG